MEEEIKKRENEIKELNTEIPWEVYTTKDMIESFDKNKLDLIAFSEKDGDSYKSITYGDVQDQVKTIGNALLKMGIKKGKKIGILSENRIEWPITYLAITSIGATVVPMDIFLKEEEIASLVRKVKPCIIFTSGKHIEKIIETKTQTKKSCQIICFDEHEGIYSEIDKRNDKGKTNSKNFRKRLSSLEKKEVENEIIFKGHEYIYYNSLYNSGKALFKKGINKYEKTVVKPDNIAALIFPSIKLGVNLTHRGIMSDVEGMVGVMGFPESQEKRWLSLLPLHHAYPTVNGFLVPLSTYSTTTLISTSKLELIFETIAETKTDYVTFVPALVERLYQSIYSSAKKVGIFSGIDLPPSASINDSFEQALKIEEKRIIFEQLKEKLGLNNLSCIFSGGGYLFTKTVQKMDFLGIEILNAYGLSETSPVISHSTPRLKRIGSAGRTYSTVDIKIDNPDENGNGEILAKGAILMHSYYKDPKLTKEVFDEDGWLHTGDIGRLDEEGFIYITGRSKNVIVNQGGKNIYPEEIEDKIKNSPFITEAAVVSKVSEDKGEFIYAHIQLNKNAILSMEKDLNKKLSEDDTRKLIQSEIQKTTEDIAHYKLPGDFDITYEKLDVKSIKDEIFMFGDPATVPMPTEELEFKTSRNNTIELNSDDQDQNQIDNDVLAESIVNYLLKKISEVIEINESEIDAELNFFDFLSSIDIVKVSKFIEEEIKIEVYPPVLFEYTNILALSGYFADEFNNEFIEYFGDDLKKTKAEGKISIEVIREEKEKNRNPAIDVMIIPKDAGKIQSKVSSLEVESNTRTSGLLSRKQKRENSTIKHKQNKFRSRASDIPVAIIGISGVFPGSRNLNEFWDHLESGNDLITEIPEDRFNWKDYYGDPQNETNKMNAKHGGFIDDMDKFDALFFKISPREAELMDPQQRIFLETVWKTIEDAGYKPSSFSGTSTGLFAGVTTTDYSELIEKYMQEIGAYAYTGISHSVLPNRISYLLDLNGPSEVIDTACSSALVAIHRARQAIANGECEMAIAGGVNALLSPKLFVSFSKTDMLSKDGKCKSFSNDADGYVRGEGVGAVLLKPLNTALEDNDHIYAIIKGSAVNHDGQSSSFTAPNPNAQADLIISAYGNSQIDPETISYIEAHGTGTNLGDPIEINAYKKAFNELYKRFNKEQPKKEYCGIGSVKTNIGHLESASGIAGFLKVLLCMKHQKLPSLLNFNELNSYIKLKDSPFYLVREEKKWECLTDENGQLLPRRAGVHSFGIGGTNAHIILEEFSADKKPKDAKGNDTTEPGSHLIVVSAKKEELLKKYVQNILNYIEREENINIADMAYTLQAGRDAMEERLAIVVTDMEDLKEKLLQYSQGVPDIKNLYRGMVKTNKSDFDPLIDGEEGEEFIRLIIKNQKHPKLARLWVSGVEIDWNLLYDKQFPRRLSLPAYPFARERHWIPDSDIVAETAGNGYHATAKIHPLIALNTSTLKEQRFMTKFMGDEFYLKDHVVGDQKILPGVAYLEMANVAGEIAIEKKVSKIKNIMWARPVSVNGTPQNVQINLYPGKDSVEFEISSSGKDDQRVVHSQGKLEYEEKGDIQLKNEVINIEEVKNRCTDKRDSSECYELFKSKGLNYGPSFQAIETLSSNGTEAISTLSLPQNLRKDFDEFILHPSIMDGALQSVMSLLNENSEEANVTYLPFALREVELIKPLSEKCYTYVSRTGSQANGSNIKKFNLQILNEAGQVLVKMNDFSVRPYQQQEEPEETESAKENNLSGNSVQPAAEMTGREQDSGAGEALQERVEKDLTKMLSELLKVRENDLDIEENVGEYGMDSINMMALLNLIEEKYGDTVEPNAMTEYPTIKSFAGYMIEEGIVESETAAACNSGTSARAASDNTTADDSAPATLTPKKQWDRFVKAAESITASAGNKSNKIAVIGMSCRFPQANSLEAYWDMLANGKTSVTEIPKDRWDIGEHYSPDRSAPNKTYSKWGGFLNDVKLFDAGFFGIPDSDAMTLDPQHRILLELTQELLDRAGYSKEDVNKSKTGVFIGGSEGSYVRNNWDIIPDEYSKHMLVNSIQNMMGARISDFYNLTGPSQTIDTACSSSLVAIHQSCRNILNGECDMAIAGGIELLIDPYYFIGFSKAGVLSEEGISHVFDKRAKGIVLSEGTGLVLLKSYEKAVEDGDNIQAVILGSAVNNDGQTMGLTVPNLHGQKEVLQQAIDNCGISPESISYFEAHGTGTSLGDPIEIKAASQVYREYTQEKQYCAVGSVKSNMGHTLRAAGMASFIKVVLAMQKKHIPATLHCETPHPRFKFEASPFYPATESRDWNPRENVRRAGVSSFGFGGTNCHMILEDFDTGNNNDHAQKRQPLPLTQFNRKSYWLGEDIVKADKKQEKPVNQDSNENDFFSSILDGIDKKELNIEEALNRMEI